MFVSSDFLCIPTCCLTLLCRVVLCQVGRTEMIKDTLSPDFVKHFVVDYFFEESQKIRFEVLAINFLYVCIIWNVVNGLCCGNLQLQYEVLKSLLAAFCYIWCYIIIYILRAQSWLSTTLTLSVLDSFGIQRAI